MEFFAKYGDHLLFLLAAALIFIPLEHVLPRHKEQKILRKNLRTDILYILIGYVFSFTIALIFIFMMWTVLGPLIPGSTKTFVFELPIWAQVIMLIIFGDLYYYWAHRTFHKLPRLWRFHAIHHSIEELDWVASHRVHPLDTALTNSGVIIIALCFGFNPVALAIHGFQFSWHSFLKHSNVNVSWGPLRWLFATPTYHHWHHGNQPDAYDKNFSGQLPLWDLVFGTAIMTEHENPEKYGVDDPVPDDFIGQLAYPFRSPEAQLAEE